MVNTVKKMIISVVCLAVLVGGLAVPQKAAATVPTFDYLLTSLQGANFLTTVAQWAKDLARWASDNLAKTLRDKFVKEVVDEINRQTVSWIQGNGSPKFVSDWKGLITKAGEDAVNQTISQSALADLCTPFKVQLKIALIPINTPLKTRAKCTITDIVSNVQSFYDNFQNGGWLAYGEAIKPENNFYMQLVIFSDETKINTNLSQEANKQEAGAGSGFLSVSTCEEDNSQDLYDQCVNDATAEGQPLTAAADSACHSTAAANKTCAKQKVQTPGDAVAGTVRNMIGADNIYISGLQSILSVAINAGINRLMTEAVDGGKGLLGMSASPSSAEGGNMQSAISGTLQSEINSYNSQVSAIEGDSVATRRQIWDTLIAIKKASAIANTELIRILTEVQTNEASGMTCTPPFSPTELTTATSLDGDLSATIATLQGKIDEANNAVLTPSGVAAFIDKYITHPDPTNVEPTVVGYNPVTGDAYTQEEFANAEKATINDKLAAVRAQLGTCVFSPPASTSTP